MGSSSSRSRSELLSESLSSWKRSPLGAWGESFGMEGDLPDTKCSWELFKGPRCMLWGWLLSRMSASLKGLHESLLW